MNGITTRLFYIWLLEHGIKHPNKWLAKELGVVPSTITKWCTAIDAGRRDSTTRTAMNKFTDIADELNGRPSAKVRSIFR